MSQEKIREDRARRALIKAGYRLHKTPARSWLREHYGAGYQISSNDLIVAGCCQREYEMGLEEVENFVASPWDRKKTA